MHASGVHALPVQLPLEALASLVEGLVCTPMYGAHDSATDPGSVPPRLAHSKSPPRGAPPVRSGKRRSGSVASERSSSYSSTDSGGRSGGGPPGGPPALGDLKRRRHENGGSAAKGA